MLKLSQLFIYPVKSLGGISVQKARVTDRGLQYDRRWMLVDNNNRAITQRTVPAMALLHCSMVPGGFTITDTRTGSQVLLPFTTTVRDAALRAVVWDDVCDVQPVDPSLDDWFSQRLGMSTRLVYMPDTSLRPVEAGYQRNSHSITSLSDGYPLLLAGQASLDDLNSRLAQPVPMNRFRPNLVFSGGAPYAEDGYAHFEINGIRFFGVKPCARCMVTTIHQHNASRSAEPLKTLAAYRRQNNNVYFGQNVLLSGKGMLAVGDAIRLLHAKPVSITLT